MKILFITRLFWPHVGGVEKHVYELSQKLKVKNQKITIVTEKYDTGLKDEETKDGTKIIRLSYPKIKFLGIFYIWFWVIKNIDLIKQSDIVHIHDVFIWYWPIRILLPNKKVYVTFHGRWGKYPIPLTDILQKRIGAKFSDGVVCIGQYIPKNYGIRADIVTFGATDIPKLNPKKDDKSTIYIGRLDKDIALQKILTVFKKLKGYKIDFCGEGELEEECRKYGKIHGWAASEPFYRKAKFIFASGYLTILEGLANHCLVFVAYENPLQKDYYELTPFREFIISSGGADDIFKKLKYYEKNPSKARKMTGEGYNWVKTQTWENLENLYIELWKSNKIL